jgi:hypothetical protein
MSGGGESQIITVDKLMKELARKQRDMDALKS